jgi:hypothetical protein
MTTDVAVPQDMQEQLDQVAQLIATLDPLQFRYFAERLLEPSRKPAQILDELRIPTADAMRWKFPAQIEEAIGQFVPGLSQMLARRIIEANVPTAAIKLTDALHSTNERTRVAVATKLLEGQGILTAPQAAPPPTQSDDSYTKWSDDDLRAALDIMREHDAKTAAIPATVQDA